MGEELTGRPACTMKKVLIYVEGQTEETFVRNILAPYLLHRCQVLLVPILARTKRTKAGRTFKGGIVSYAKVKKDILRLLTDSSAALVTTMIDYYGLPNDFPGKNSLPLGTPYQRVTHLEKEFARDINHSRFLPFIILHEFEAFVLVDPNELSQTLPQHKANLPQLVRSIGGQMPEEVNEGKDTHPSARIRRYFPSYQKALHGPLIVQRVGLESIRCRCPHFNDWLSKLESLCTSRGRP